MTISKAIEVLEELKKRHGDELQLYISVTGQDGDYRAKVDSIKKVNNQVVLYGIDQGWNI